MILSSEDAIEIAWAAFLDELGETHVPNWRVVGFMGSVLLRHNNGEGLHPFDIVSEHWHVLFFSFPFRSPNELAGRIFVDKQTGHCNVWINEDYAPKDPHFDYTRWGCPTCEYDSCDTPCNCPDYRRAVEMLRRAE